MHIEAHDSMPNLKVGRVMPVVIDLTTLLFHWRRTKSIFKTEAILRKIYRRWQFLSSRPCLCLLTFM